MISLVLKSLTYAVFSASIAIAGISQNVHIDSVLPVAVAEAPIESDDFSGYSDLKEICTCESGLKHYSEDGSVLIGRVNKNDIGICQINKYYHKKEIEALGVNIYTRKGNISFAKYLYDKYGSAPWIWSKQCWGKNK